MPVMNKPVIAVDIDEVLLPHFEDLITWYNKTYGTFVKLADNGNHDLKVWDTNTLEEAVKRVHSFYETSEFKSAKPFHEALGVLNTLSHKYDLVVVTARDSIIEESTRLWLKEHFKDLIMQAHFTAFYSLEGKMRKKADVCLEIKAKYLIDDSLGNILGAAEVDVHGILFGDYPGNQIVELPPNVIRCKDWAAVLEYFNAES